MGGFQFRNVPLCGNVIRIRMTQTELRQSLKKKITIRVKFQGKVDAMGGRRRGAAEGRRLDEVESSAIACRASIKKADYGG